LINAVGITAVHTFGDQVVVPAATGLNPVTSPAKSVPRLRSSAGELNAEASMRRGLEEAIDLGMLWLTTKMLVREHRLFSAVLVHPIHAFFLVRHRFSNPFRPISLPLLAKVLLGFF